MAGKKKKRWGWVYYDCKICILERDVCKNIWDQFCGLFVALWRTKVDQNSIHKIHANTFDMKPRLVFYSHCDSYYSWMYTIIESLIYSVCPKCSVFDVWHCVFACRGANSLFPSRLCFRLISKLLWYIFYAGAMGFSSGGLACSNIVGSDRCIVA